jgi:hypothetical protein
MFQSALIPYRIAEVMQHANQAGVLPPSTAALAAAPAAAGSSSSTTLHTDLATGMDCESMLHYTNYITLPWTYGMCWR